MLRHALIQLVIDGEGGLHAFIARDPAGIGIQRAQGAGIKLHGLLELPAGFLLLAAGIQNEADIQRLQRGVPVRPLKIADGGDGVFRIVRAIIGPAGEQNGGQIADRPAHGKRQIAARRAILLLAQGVHPQGEAGDAVGIVHLHQPAGEADGIIHVAIHQGGEEGAFHHLGIARIKFEQVAQIGDGGIIVAFGTGKSGGQIAAGNGGLLICHIGRGWCGRRICKGGRQGWQRHGQGSGENRE